MWLLRHLAFQTFSFSDILLFEMFCISYKSNICEFILMCWPKTSTQKMGFACGPWIEEGTVSEICTKSKTFESILMMCFPTISTQTSSKNCCECKVRENQLWTPADEILLRPRASQLKCDALSCHQCCLKPSPEVALHQKIFSTTTDYQTSCSEVSAATTTTLRLNWENQLCCVRDRCVLRAVFGDDAQSCLEPG